MRRVAQRPLGPPRWVFHAVCAVLTLRLLWMVSRPEYYLADDDAALPRVLLFGCALVWLARLIATLRRRERLGGWWLVAPVAGVVVAALIGLHVPLHLHSALT